MDLSEEELISQIKENIEKIYFLRSEKKKFVPGKTWVQYAGSVLDYKEINASVNSLVVDGLNGWFGLGAKGEELEKGLAQFLGVKGSILTNSGSSANLLCVASLRSNFFPNHLEPGDEVITTAVCYPTTVNAIVLNGLVPVFLDSNPETLNVEAEALAKALSPKTRAVFLTHTLGNPNEMEKVVKFCEAHDLFLVEDNCDALGSEYDGRRTGSFGILASQSFYPPHHMTMGEGGAVHYSDLRFERITRSLRDWGRSCWCRGDDKTTHGACGARFNYRVAGRPYDHKYLFSHLGYNLKPIEPQAAMGVEQLKRVPSFIEKRAENFKRFYGYAQNWQDYFILPRSLPAAKPCWFAFPLTIRDEAKFDRRALTVFLEEKMIQTRPLFAGNITKQPAYRNFKVNFRIAEDLRNADRVLFNNFFLGIYPGLGAEEIDYMAENIEAFLKLKG